MTEPWIGGCACGAVRYRIPGEPFFMNDCQCRACQHRSGTGHGSYLSFPNRADAALSGPSTTWNIAADSGNVKTHGFCSTCGSPVWLTFSEAPEVLTVHAASLDDPGRYRPQAVTCHASGQDWDHLDPALTKFDGMPPPPG